MSDAVPQSSPWPITRALLDLAWPIIGLNVLAVLAMAIDTAMIGRLADAENALTGVGYASQLVWLLMVAMIGLTVGTVAFVARAHGGGESERVAHILHQSTQLTVLLGIGIAVFGNLVATPLLVLLGAQGATLDSGLAYLRPLLLGSVFVYLNILYAAVLRGVGNTRLAFGVALLMNGLNVGFNYVLIFGQLGFPALGVLGAALGTVLSQICALVAMIAMLQGNSVPGLRPRLAPEPIDRPLTRDLIRIGWPAALDMVVINASFMSIIGLLARLDEVAVAAHTIGLRVQALAFVPGMSISQATGAMVGNALGAARVPQARQVVRISVVLCTGVMTALGLTLVGFAGPLVELFNVRPQTPIFDYSVLWMQILGYGMPLIGVWISWVGMLQGSGATRTSLRINISATLFLQIPLSYILGFPLGLGVWGVWAAFPVGYVLKMVWGWWVYRGESWTAVGVRI